jgi:polar amino acid transport system substrate-binding protein
VAASIDPSKQPKVFDDSNTTVTALKQNQVEAVVTDLPTALFLTAVEIPSATVVGQFSAPGGDTWGALLEKDSSLTDCVSKAISDLRESGELEQITEKWMGSETAPELN